MGPDGVLIKARATAPQAGATGRPTRFSHRFSHRTL
jgi:hypothetical protein